MVVRPAVDLLVVVEGRVEALGHVLGAPELLEPLVEGRERRVAQLERLEPRGLARADVLLDGVEVLLRPRDLLHHLVARLPIVGALDLRAMLVVLEEPGLLRDGDGRLEVLAGHVLGLVQAALAREQGVEVFALGALLLQGPQLLVQEALVHGGCPGGTGGVVTAASAARDSGCSLRVIWVKPRRSRTSGCSRSLMQESGAVSRLCRTKLVGAAAARDP